VPGPHYWDGHQVHSTLDAVLVYILSNLISGLFLSSTVPMFLAGIRSTYRGVLSLGRRLYHIKGRVQLSDIEEHMRQHVKNVCERTALQVINLLTSKLYKSYTLDPGPTLWFRLYTVFITTFL